MTGGFVRGGRERGVGRVTLAVVALLAGGCDTVAEISFTQRELQGAATNGVLNANACTDTDTEVRFTFDIFDGDDVLIAPGEVIGDQQIQLGTNFSEQDIAFQDSFLYPSPDQPCTGDGDCSAPFSCVAVNPFNSGASDLACGMAVTVETLQRDLTFDDGEDDKSIAIIMDVSGTLLGQSSDGNFNPECSTDRRDQRIAGARGFLLRYGASAFAADTSVCVVSMGGEDIGGVLFAPTPDNCMESIGDSAGASAVDGRLAELTIGEEGPTPIWAAVVETINQQLVDAPGDRIIILFTDGPDDGSVSADFNAALAAALDNGVTVHVVELDAPPTAADCRVANAAPGDRDLFAQLACETGGSYQYATGPNDLRALFENLAGTVAARYQMQAQVIALADQGLPADVDTYRLATGVQITLAGTTIRIQLAGDKIDPATANLIDDRLNLFVRPVPPPPEGTGS